MRHAETVRLERDANGVATLTIDRQAVHNALDWLAMEAFAAAVDELASASDRPAAGDRRAETTVGSGADGPAPTAVIVTGAGTEAFSSGGDQRALAGATSRQDGARLARTMGDALARLERLPVPVIAAVNGIALGGGAEIALACDVRIVDEAVRFGLVHLRLGLVPGWGGGQRLVRQVGPSRAARMLLEARGYTAQELWAMGLADEVVAVGQATAAARRFAERIAAFDPGTVGAVKRLLLAARAGRYEDGLAAERRLFEELWPAPAHLRALEAFGRD